MKRFTSVAIISFFILCHAVEARPTSANDANNVAKHWLKSYPEPLNAPLGKSVDRIETRCDESGTPLYFIVPLKPAGFVIISADDEIEPVIAFSAGAFGARTTDNSIFGLLEHDMRSRLAAIKEQKPAGKALRASAKGKWQRLEGMQADSGTMQALDATAINDIRVAPLLGSTWGQGDAGAGHCYNYYTPNYYPCGCVATAAANVMRYYGFPTTTIGKQSCSITVDGYSQAVSTKGGDGNGGPYDWTQMPLCPDSSLTDTQRQQIGALCFDIGALAGMSYTRSASSASTTNAKNAMVNTFGYSQAVYGWRSSGSMPTGLTGMINPNLDAGCPVMLDLSQSESGGHAVVADGYGYSSGTLYHHIDVGWDGPGNAWYALPTIDVVSPAFNTIDGCTYNILKTGTGEIISGRITDRASNPLPGVTVSAVNGSTTVAQCVTNMQGIYAITHLAANTTYTITAVKTPFAFSQRSVPVGLSVDFQSSGGNSWQSDIASTTVGPPTAYDQTIPVRSGTSQTITLPGADDGDPSPPGALTYTVTSLPRYGRLSLPGGAQITAVPFTLAGYAKTVVYQACPYFSGNDTLQFTVNDGGTAPTGGVSRTATLTLAASNTWTYTLDPGSNTTANLTVDTSSYAARTQTVYLSSELGGAQTITSLAVNFCTPPGTAMNNFTIRMQHTSMDQIPSYAPDFWLTSGWTTVYRSTVTVGGGGWKIFAFATPFVYNGTSNLMIDWSFNNTTTNSPGSILIVSATNRDMTLQAGNTSYGDPLTWDYFKTGGSYLCWNAVPDIRLISSVTANPLSGDVDRNCRVDLRDVAFIAAAWQKSQGQAGFDPDCDISSPKDNVINFKDLTVTMSQWLQVYPY